ncbi:helix-turn-helix domain-containing protein [Actinomadura harenae]|uniref:helix-turn-helix domain-containing protein n=1 Tax=Actinomadura harenae TaxID=2483351 RepID=UPI0018F61F26|nr:helix-turn-helix transcriptional regulator [Actinomadura harenae]
MVAAHEGTVRDVVHAFNERGLAVLWTGTPTTIRLDDLDVICSILDYDPAALLICEPDKGRGPAPGQGADRGRRTLQLHRAAQIRHPQVRATA